MGYFDKMCRFPSIPPILGEKVRAISSPMILQLTHKNGIMELEYFIHSANNDEV